MNFRLFAMALMAMVFAMNPAPAQQAPGQVEVSAADPVLRGAEQMRVFYNPAPRSLWCTLVVPENGTGPAVDICSGHEGGDIVLRNSLSSDGTWRFPAGPYLLVGRVPVGGEHRFTERALRVNVETIATRPGVHWTNVEGALAARRIVPLNGVIHFDLLIPRDARFFREDWSATALQINGRTLAVSLHGAPPRSGFALMPPAGSRDGDNVTVAAVAAFDAGVGEAAWKWVYGTRYLVGGTTTPPTAGACVATFVPPLELRIPGSTRTHPTRGNNGNNEVFEIPAVRRMDGLGFEVPNFDFVFAYPANTRLLLGTTSLTFTYSDGFAEAQPYGNGQIFDGDDPSKPRNPAARGLSVRPTLEPRATMRFQSQFQPGFSGGCTALDSGPISFRVVEVQR
jgi:hypothetical protein